MYEIFISYASEDRVWAAKLHDMLSQRFNIRMFWDHESLRAAEDWADQLFDACFKSTHLIVLSSAHAAKEGSWVKREIDAFRMARGRKPVQERGKIISLVLDTLLDEFQHQHQITDIKIADAYAAGPDNMSSHIWNIISWKILNAIGKKDLPKPIQRVILTVDRSGLDEIPFDARPSRFAQTLHKLLTDSGHSREELEKRYGQHRSDWKPFGGDADVVQITNEILDRINREFKPKHIWEDSTEAIMNATDRGEAIKLIKHLQQSPSLVIIDPIALYHPDIKEIFAMMEKCLDNSTALMISFAPFEPPQAYHTWRKMVEDIDFNFHSRYFRPTIPKAEPSALFSASPVDRKEAERYIQELINVSSKSDADVRSNSPFTNLQPDK